MRWIVLCLLSLLAACGRQADAPSVVLDDAPRPAKMIEVRADTADEVYAFPAVIRARESVELAFDIAGMLIQLDVREGRVVAQGTVLAMLDKADLETRLSAATAAAELAETELARFERLRDAVAVAEVDRRRAAAAAATAELAAARNAVQKAEIRAPFDGVVARRLARNFGAVQAKQPIVLYQALSPLDVVIDVPEPLMRMAVPQDDAAASASLVFAGQPETRHAIRFHEVSTEADPQTQSYAVVFTLERPRGITVLPGMTATVELRAARASSAPVFLLPPLAVMGAEAGEPRVWVVDPETSAVSERTVALGRLRGDLLEITAGLADGDRVVVAGMSKLRAGMRVRPHNP